MHYPGKSWLRLAWVLALAMLLLASLACGLSNITGGGGDEGTGEEEVEPAKTPEEKSIEAQEPTPEPTKVVPTEEPTPAPLEEEETEEPTKEPPPEPAGDVINAQNAKNLGERRTITASPSSLTGAAFSPIDHRIAEFGFDKVVRIYDADTGKLIHEMTGHGDYGFDLAWSPDGKKLASGGQGSDVRLWDVDSGTEIAWVQTYGTRIYDLWWAADSDRVAIVGERTSRITILDGSGAKINELQPFNGGWIWSVTWSKTYLAAGNDTTKTIYVYDADSYALLKELKHSYLVAAGLSFSPDDSLLASCHRDGMVAVWNTENWSRVMDVVAHPGSFGWDKGCSTIEFGKAGDIVFTGGDDNWLHVWNAQTGAQIKSFKMGGFVWDLSVSGDGTMMMVSLGDGTVHILGLP